MLASYAPIERANFCARKREIRESERDVARVARARVNETNSCARPARGDQTQRLRARGLGTASAGRNDQGPCAAPVTVSPTTAPTLLLLLDYYLCP